MSRNSFDTIGFATSVQPTRHRAPVAMAVAAAEAARAIEGQHSESELLESLREILGIIDRAEGVGVPVALAARMLHVSQPTVRAWISKGVLDTVPDVKPVTVKPGSLGEVSAAVAEIRQLGEDRRLLESVMHALADRRTIEELTPRLGKRSDQPEVEVTDEVLDELLG